MLLRMGKALHGYIVEQNRFFGQGWEYVTCTNLHLLSRCTGIAAIVMGFYLVYGWLNASPLPVLLAYGASMMLHAGFFVWIRGRSQALRWRPRVVRALCTLFTVELLALTVFIATVAMPQEPGIFFGPFCLVLSIIFIFPLWQSAALTALATAAFVMLSAQEKTTVLFQLDLSLGVVTALLSLIVGVEVFGLRLRDFRMRTELTRLSNTDSLTGLMNKTATESAARLYLAHCGIKGAALFVIDLDQFKQINDRLGHHAGDAALEIVGNTLTNLFRAQDIVGRVGGDEFVALMKNAGDPRMVAHRAALICSMVRKARLEHFSLSLTCSVGVVLCPRHGSSYDELFQKADEQLYQVKRAGRNGYRVARG